MLKALMPKKVMDKRGPHNNWRRENGRGDESSFDESGAGFGGDGGHH
jgi:hypothetical protein